MTHTYFVEGMSCVSCAKKIQEVLLKVKNIKSAKVDFTSKKAVLEMVNHIDLSQLNKAILKIGNYKLSETQANSVKSVEGIKKFIPLILVLSLVVLLSLVRPISSGGFDLMYFMRDFMAGFFIIFGGFKVIKLKAFAESFATYDILAYRSKFYSFIYPFIELGLGFSYIFSNDLFYTNIATIFIMFIGSIGVYKALISKRKFVCACLGAVFKIPMTWVTLIEDLVMLIMAILMFFI